VSVNDLGLAIKQLQRKYDVTGQELSRSIGITASSLSQIVNGHAKPRQGTFTKLCERLVQNPEDEKQLVDAFVKLKPEAPETVVVDADVYEQAEIERAERFLEAKAQSIAFKRSVARELDKAGLSYQADYCEGIYVTDFLVEHAGKRYAVECKFNVNRDFEKTVRIAGVLLEKLPCSTLFIVIPFADEKLEKQMSKELNINLIVPHQIQKELR